MVSKHNKNGFTLIELIVVVVVMGAILAIGIPSVSYFQKTQNARECHHNMELLQNRIKLFRAGDLDEKFHMRWYAGSYNPETKTWENWFNDNSMKIYSAYYYTEDKSFESKDIICKTPSEYLLRTIYNFNGEIEDFEFPTTGTENCSLYITFVPGVDNNTYGKTSSEISKLSQKKYYGSIVIHCTCPEHELAEPLTVVF